MPPKSKPHGAPGVARRRHRQPDVRALAARGTAAYPGRDEAARTSKNATNRPTSARAARRKKAHGRAALRA